MPFSSLPAFLATCFSRLATALDPRSAARLPALLIGLLLARGRRTCASWFRACGVTDDFRRAYNVIGSCGRRADWVAVRLLPAVDPLLAGDRLVVAFDDTPTSRWGPRVGGAGVHHNPKSGPAGEKFVYGHVWVTLAAPARHPGRGTIALPPRSEMYVRDKDIERLDPDRRPPFRTKLEMAAELLGWVMTWRGWRFKEVWAVVDGGYPKRPFLRAARERGVVVVGRLPADAALRGLPDQPAPARRGRKPVYGKKKVVPKMRAGQLRGWDEVSCRQCGRRVTKWVKTSLATWRPAGGLIRVVLVQEGHGWRAYFCTKATATAEEVLEAVADRTAIEQTFKDVKETWGAGQQQVRNLHANVGASTSVPGCTAWSRRGLGLSRKRSWWAGKTARGTGSTAGRLTRTSARRCSANSCAGKSKRPWQIGLASSNSANWPNACFAWLLEHHGSRRVQCEPC